MRYLCTSFLIVVIAGARLGAADDAPIPFPDLAPQVGEILANEYYDPSRFQPRVMVERALRALEQAEIALDLEWTDAGITLRHGDDASEIEAAEPADLRAAMLILDRLSAALEERFEPQRLRQLEYSMLNGALQSLDPHTLLMPPRPASEFKESMQAKFYGIGAFLNQSDGMVRIERVMPGLPADQAGIEDGDVILAVDGEKISGLSLSQVVRRIKGPKGTEVLLTVERETEAGEHREVDIAITRDLVKVVTMVHHRQGNVGYVRMDEFNRRSNLDLWDRILRLSRGDEPVKAFVLDLRFNGGGLLGQAHRISDFFLPAGREIVQTVYLGQEPKELKAGRRQLLEVPMVVLVSPSSASASEILAGSLQLNDRAVIVGQKTFGKGTVQTIRELKDESQLKYTIQEYRLPGGVSIQERGVHPDVELLQHRIREDGELDLVPYTSQREEDQEFSLTADVLDDHDAVYRLGWVAEHWTDEQWKHSRPSSRNFRPDQEAAFVIGLVAAALARPDAGARLARGHEEEDLRSAMLDLLGEPIAAASRAESERISEILAEREPPIPWGEELAFDGPLEVLYDGPATLVAGEEVDLTFRVANRGDVPATQLFGLIEADDASPFWEDEVVFGEVAPGGTASGSLRIQVPPRVYSGEERFVLRIFQDDRAELLAEHPVVVRLEGKPRPRFGYEWRLYDAESGEDRPLVLDGDNRLEVEVTNHGAGDAFESTLYVFKDGDSYTQLGEGRFRLPALPSGESATVIVPLSVRSEPPPGMREVEPGERVVLQLRLEENPGEGVDARYRGGFFHTLELARPGRPGENAEGPTTGTVVEPSLALASERTGEERVAVSLRLRDDNPRYLSMFRGDDKIRLLPLGEGAGDDEINFTLDLEPGINSFRFVAADADDVISIQPLRLWGPHEPRVTTAKGDGDGGGSGEVLIP